MVILQEEDELRIPVPDNYGSVISAALMPPRTCADDYGVEHDS
jgi:hypothetical protein